MITIVWTFVLTLALALMVWVALEPAIKRRRARREFKAKAQQIGASHQAARAEIQDRLFGELRSRIEEILRAGEVP